MLIVLAGTGAGVVISAILEKTTWKKLGQIHLPLVQLYPLIATIDNGIAVHKGKVKQLSK